MASLEPDSAGSPPPPSSPFQSGVKTILLLFVVLGSSIAVFGAWGILVFALVVGLAVYLREAESLFTFGQILPVLLLLAGLIVLLLPSVQIHREMGRDAVCRNNLKLIVLALLSYAQEHDSLPPAYTVDGNGAPMHSWRTRILPELEHNELYTACDFAKPWDAPKNKATLNKRLMIFICPSDPPVNVPVAAQTNYFAVVGPNTAWPGDKPRSLAEIRNQASHTILLVEAADAGVAWAEPKDISLDMLRSTDGALGTLRLSSNHRPPEDFFYRFDCVSGVNIALADSSVTFLRTDNLSPEELRKIFQIGGFTDDVISKQTDVQSARHLNWPNIAALVVWLVSVYALLTGAVRGRAGQDAQPATENPAELPSSKK